MNQNAHHVPSGRCVVEYLLLEKEREIEEGAIVGADVKLSKCVEDEVDSVLPVAYQDGEVIAVEGSCNRRQVDGYRHQRRQQKERRHPPPRTASSLSKRGLNW